MAGEDHDRDMVTVSFCPSLARTAWTTKWTFEVMISNLTSMKEVLFWDLSKVQHILASLVQFLNNQDQRHEETISPLFWLVNEANMLDEQLKNMTREAFSLLDPFNLSWWPLLAHPDPWYMRFKHFPFLFYYWLIPNKVQKFATPAVWR